MRSESSTSGQAFVNLGADDFDWLLADDEKIRVSIYLPLADPSEDAHVNGIRFKNALREADRQLEEAGLDKPARGRYLDPIESLVTDAENWDRTGGGLCLFSDGESLRVRKGPEAWEEIVSVGDCFQVLPAIALCQPPGPVYVLALSQKHAWLARVTRNGAEQVELGENTPTSLEEAVGREREEQHLQFHSGKGGSDAPIYHAQGGGKDDVEPELEKFCRAVDEGLEKILKREGDGSSTLLLAGDVQLTSIFQRITSAKIFDVVAGNYDNYSPEALREAASDKLDALHRQRVTEACGQYETAKGRELTSANESNLREAASGGRIDMLLVKTDASAFSPAAGDESADSVLNRVSISTLNHGGQVRLVPKHLFPETSSDLAGTLRY